MIICPKTVLRVFDQGAFIEEIRLEIFLNSGGAFVPGGFDIPPPHTDLKFS